MLGESVVSGLLGWLEVCLALCIVGVLDVGGVIIGGFLF